MNILTRTIFIIAMLVLGIVSMWTTYRSLHDSILPEPVVQIHLGGGTTWDCSIFALGLSLAIGMMLFALKVAVIDGQKRLNIFGVLGMTIVSFISIAFNLDVLYRTADHEFFMRYSTDKVKSVYEKYLTEAQTDLLTKREKLQKIVARQEGELDAEVKGLRRAPAGYGTRAREEDYALTVLQKTTAVELQGVEEALSKKDEADNLLRSATPETVGEIETLQSQLRVVAKDIGSAAGLPMPETVKMENPLFAVFERVFNWNTIGVKEVFFVVIAFFLDLGDIIGYCMVPNKPKRRRQDEFTPLAAMGGDGASTLELPERLTLFADKREALPEIVPDAGEPILAEAESKVPVEQDPADAASRLVEAAEEAHRGFGRSFSARRRH